MTLKRIVLAFLTFLAVFRILLSLTGSLTEPQIQGTLELYQTNLVLYGSEFELEEEDNNLSQVIGSALGKEPKEAAIKQYQKVRKEARVAKDNFQSQLDNLKATSEVNIDRAFNISPQLKQLEQQVFNTDNFIEDLDLKEGILLAETDRVDSALSTWNNVITKINDPEDENSQTASILSNLWQKSPQVLANSESIITDNLDSWFLDKSLERLYQIKGDRESLNLLQSQKQTKATQALLKLSFIGLVPLFLGIIGFALLIFLVIQFFIKKESSILAIESKNTWNIPWNWEITWQVIIVGFFFIGQFALPFFLQILGLDVSNASLKIKALYVFFSYILMAAGGIITLYISIKSFFPLPEKLFNFKLLDNWFVWGFGGYLVAIPSVIFISIINQQIWQGQGGSNPLISLALQAQDKIALAIFFTTASIAAPIFEEIIFRGFLLPSLTRYVSVTTAIILSGFLFAIAHLSLSEVLPLATLGIILGFVYTRSRNLLSSILLHSLWNSGTLINLFILGSGIQ